MSFHFVKLVSYSQTRQYPLVGLMKLLEQQQDEFNATQRQELLQIAFDEQPKENINGTFVEVINPVQSVCKLDFQQTFLRVFQTGSSGRQTPTHMVINLYGVVIIERHDLYILLSCMLTLNEYTAQHHSVLHCIVQSMQL